MAKVPVTRLPGDLEEIARGALDELRLVWPDHAITSTPGVAGS